MEHISVEDEETQLEAVRRFADIICWIDNPSEKVQLETVKKDGLLIEYIENPTEEVQLEAIKQHPEILNNIDWYIQNPCQEILDMLMIKDIIE